MLFALSHPLNQLICQNWIYPNGCTSQMESVFIQAPWPRSQGPHNTSQNTNFFFPSLPGGSRLCSVSTLKEYESRTQPLRERETKLLVSIIKPHKAVSSSTVARWLKSLLEASGIDTPIFSHSVRGASSSAVASAGISTSDILKAAGWSSESTFQQFYYRPTGNPSFGRAVHSQHSQPATNNTVDM